MSIHITATKKDGENKNVSLYDYPDECPICHHSITPLPHSQGYYDPADWTRADCLQLILRCPRISCQRLFIAYYRPDNSSCASFQFQYFKPIDKRNKEFSSTIKSISENFCLIYNQSLSAEQDGLLEICGVGYRKSLEFLIKDYLIKMKPDKEVAIKEKALAKCISEDIKNDNIKNVAKRAAWLGNDETHYLRKWEGKDLQDLKKLIDLSVHWFEMEALTEEVIKDMPEPVKTGE